MAPLFRFRKIIQALSSKKTSRGSGDGSALSAWPGHREKNGRNLIELHNGRTDSKIDGLSDAESGSIGDISFGGTTQRVATEDMTMEDFLKTRSDLEWSRIPRD
ncbi:MAG: hypothetical protein M4579_000181 [Chaenotheca gracillima]|nr:MAG: hypothetical protein M4579_000181 [Chaenotheca gracillima]